MQGQESDEIDQQRLITVKGVKEAMKGLWSGKKKDKMKKTLKSRSGRSMKRFFLQTRYANFKFAFCFSFLFGGFFRELLPVQ